MVRMFWTLLIALLLFGPWPKDFLGDSKPPRIPARALLARALVPPQGQSTPRPLQAGVAVVDITELAENVPLAGYGQRVFRPSQGVADPISARALVLGTGEQRVVMVTADLLLINTRLANAVMKHLEHSGWQRHQVYFGATHTHSGPGGFPSSLVECGGLGLDRARITTNLAQKLADAVEQAAQNLVPCEMGGASVQVPANYITNRTREDDSANRWLDLLVVRRHDRQALACVAVFGAHATCRSSRDDRISSDYPGALRRELEARGAGTCLFFAGAVGSMGPPYTLWPRDELDHWYGTQLGKQAAAALDNITFHRAPKVRAVGCRVPLPPARVKIGAGWRLSPLTTRLLLPHETWIQGLRLGDRVFLATPADYSGVLAEQLRANAPMSTTVVTSFNGEYVGYLLPPEYDDLPKYEPRSMSLYGRDAGAYFQELLGQMAQGL